MKNAASHQRALMAVSVLASAGLFVAGCGVSVAAGGNNAATHPASGIFDSNTVGGGADVSGKPAPPVPYNPPSNKPPAVLPAGLRATAKAVEAAVKGGCWQDSHQGDLFGAYDQLFWWQGDCGDTVAQVTVELFASAAQAKAEERHAVSQPLLARYLEGAVLVNVWANAPLSVVTSLSAVKGLVALPGYS